MRTVSVNGVVLAAVLLVPVFSLAALPDPTRPFTYLSAIQVDREDGAGAIQWRLNGIRIGESKRSAILNGQVVKIGDSVAGATVTEINPAEVVLSRDHQRVVVRLLYSRVKQPAREAPAPDAPGRE